MVRTGNADPKWVHEGNFDSASATLLLAGVLASRDRLDELLKFDTNEPLIVLCNHY